jgi:subtilase family serine protease
MKVTRSEINSTALVSLCLVLSSLASLAQTNAVRARVTQAVNMQNLVTLRGNVHPLARSANDQGVAPDGLPMRRMLLVLQRGADQEASLRQLLDQQQVKSSPQFHQWLTPEQFGQQFGPADSDLQAVTGWLTAQGFEVTKVAAGRTVIEFSGTAGLVRKVLGTEIHKFRVNGEDYWANASDPQIPAALAPVVAGIDSFNNFPRKPLHESVGTFRRDKATGKVEPLFSNPTTCSGGGSGCYNLTVGPGDFATIYNVSPLWTAGTDGTGQTLAVVGETNINIQDVRDFRTMFGLPANDPNIILNGPDPGILTDGEETEADLDVEWSGGVAKGATVDFVVSESTETTAGIDLSVLYIVDNNLAPILSESYGGCEQALGTAGNAFYNTLWEQAAAQGITVLLGSGDSGSAGCDSANPIVGEIAATHGLAVSGFASTPFNVAVGGTDFALTQSNYSTYWSTANTPPYQSSAKSYIPETTWSYSCADSGGLSGCTPPPDSSSLDSGYYLVAGGGGPSQVYSKPSWQSGTGVPQDSARDIPDVSLLAGSWYVICEMDANASAGGSSTSCDLNSPYLDFQLEAGTSASVQAFAGVMALVNQAHRRQGNANYVLYPLAAGANTCASTTAAVSKTSCIFYDTQTGNNSVICAGGTPNCSNATSGQYGIIVFDNPPAAAYPTTTGYDLATGLGSVNVANLVKNWASNFTTTTTTLTLTPTSPATLTTLVHGQAVGFNIGVASGSGTPSGDVSLIAQTGAASNNMTGIGPFTLSGGSAAGSTVMLPGGSYNVTAHYAGNGTYAAGDSTPGIPVTVSKENSLTEIHLVTFDSSGTIIPNSGSIVYGSPYILRMDVTNSSGNLCVNPSTEVTAYPCPTNGSNAFGLTVTPTPTDVNAPTGTTPGQYRLNSQGYAEDQPIQLPTGQYPFVASYAGDNSYNPSSSSALPVTVTQALTTTSISGVPSSGVVGTQVTVTATVTTASLGVAPTGTMQLLNNGFPVGSPVLVSGSSATAGGYAKAQAILTVSLSGSSLSISVEYSGDGNYATSTSPAAFVTVSDFGLSANPSPVTISAPGQQGSSIISVTPQNGFTGSVNLSVASGCPTGATCTFTSPTINVSSASAVTDMLTITTTGTGSTVPSLQRRIPPSFPRPVGLLWFLAGSLALGMLLSSSGMQRRPAALLFAISLLVVGVWAACGGGGGGGGTPPPTPVPAVGLSATTLNFSSENTGSTSAAQSVTLTNTGNGSLSITSIGLAGTNPGDYSDTNTCGSSVAAGANCAISVKFTPTTTGTRSATVSIVDNASGSPQSISLIGTGTQPTPPTPAGTYPIVVYAASGADTHTLTVNVTVQ